MASPVIESPFLRTVRPLLLVSIPFCAAPYLRWSSTPTTNHKLTRCLRCLNHIYASVYLAVVTYAFSLQSFDQVNDTELFEKCILAARFLIYWINLVIIVVGAQRHHHCYARFMRNLADIDNQLHRIAGNPAANLLRLQRFLLGCCLALFSAMLASAVVDFFTYDQRQLVPWLRSVIVFLTSNCTVCLTILQLCAGLWCLADRFAAVATLMRSTLRRKAVIGKLDQLRALRRLHMEVAQLHDQLMAAFGWFMVCLVASTIVDLTVQLYMIYMYAVNLEPDARGYLKLYTVLWFTMHAGKLVLILCFSDRVQKEKMGPPQVAAEAYAAISGFGREDKELSEQLLKLQIQAMHDRRPCVASGIVQMDLTLVASIIGSITGLLVIMIQFASSN